MTALTEQQILNTTTDQFDVEYRYFAGPLWATLIKSGLATALADWTAPDTGKPSTWTEITERVSFASRLSQVKNGASINWTADLSGWNYDEALLGLGQSVLCWRRIWRPTGNAPTYGANLISNAGFELFTGTADNGVTDIFTDWIAQNLTGNVIEASTTRYAGNTAAKLTWAAGGNPYISQTVAVTGGRQYRWRFYTRGDGTLDMRYGVYNPCSGTWIVNPWQPTGVTGTTWTPVDVDFAQPVGCSSVSLYFSTASGYGTAYVDDVALQELIPATAPAGWQPWEREFVGEFASRENRQDYRNGKEWKRSAVGYSNFLTHYNAPRITAGKIRLTEGAPTPTGTPPLTLAEQEADKGEFVGGTAMVGLDNLIDGNKNTVYISATIPSVTVNPWPSPLHDGGTHPSEVFIKPIAGWPTSRTWWIECYNQRSQNDKMRVGFQLATHDAGGYHYYVAGDGSKWSELNTGACALFVANRQSFDEYMGSANNGAAFIVDVSQYTDGVLTMDAAVLVGNSVIAWSPGGAWRDYVFQHAWGPTEYHGYTLNSDALPVGQSWRNTFEHTPWTLADWAVNAYPHPGANNTGVGPIWVKVELPDNVCLTLDELSSSSVDIRLDNYKGWIAGEGGWGPTAYGVVNGYVFGWRWRDANGLHGVTWQTPPAAPIPAGTRCYPYADGAHQTGYPVSSTSLIRRKLPTISHYKVYWSPTTARNYEQPGWPTDYPYNPHEQQGNTQNLVLGDKCGTSSKGTNGRNYLWIRTIMYLIYGMTDGGRVKINEIDATLNQSAADLTGAPAMDGEDVTALAKHLWWSWAGLPEDDFHNDITLGGHTMGQHALAITPIARVYDDLGQAAGCLVWYDPQGGVRWLDDPWWPLSNDRAVTYTFDAGSVREAFELSQSPVYVDYVILNALSLEVDPHPLRYVYPQPFGMSEPPVWAMTSEVNDRVIARDADAAAVAQMELERLQAEGRTGRVVVKGVGEWCRPGLRVQTVFDADGDGVSDTLSWLIERVETTREIDQGGIKRLETILTLRGFRG